MSDPIKHECGIAFIRLKKPLNYYHEKYGSCLWGLNKMYLLMEKQHNRGQDGAGIATIKLDPAPGTKYIDRVRSADDVPIQKIFAKINKKFNEVGEKDPALLSDGNWLKENVPFAGELILGHLRYGTYGKNAVENTHPFVRGSNWMTRNLVVAGNFNLTNVDELFQKLVELGQFPREKSDSVTMLEKIGHFLDEENRRILRKYEDSDLNAKEVVQELVKQIDVQTVLEECVKKWDGGYVFGGMVGHGESFLVRDPNGIRPAYWYEDDEVVVVASERPVIQTAFDLPFEAIQELQPGHALIVRKSGETKHVRVHPEKPKTSCSFERIYFSRGSDWNIYKERKALGKNLVPQILEEIDHDLDNSVFSFIPNTAESCFYGLHEGLNEHMSQKRMEKLQALPDLSDEVAVKKILEYTPRVEKIAIKDAKLRTFIHEDNSRDDLVAHVYDVTYGTVFKNEDNLIVIDDSIVRGTTLKQSIIRILDRLHPKKVVVVSSAPQIRYPDCYGIDMAKMGDFIAFQAAITLLKERNMAHIIDETYAKCQKALTQPKEEIQNWVKDIYAPFSDEEISKKIAELLTPVGNKAEVAIIYQTIDNLRKAIPEHIGDWYFSGNYPTPGGNKVVCQSFVNYIEGKNERAY